GPNGAGKSTAVGIITGLVPKDGGEVLLDGISIDREPRRARALVGFVPQELSIYPTLDLLENLTFIADLHGLPRGEERARAALAQVGLADRLGEPVRSLSGGMKRRLNLAMGIVHRPSVILMDEPTVGVDPQSRQRIVSVVRELATNGAA